MESRRRSSLDGILHRDGLFCVTANGSLMVNEKAEEEEQEAEAQPLRWSNIVPN